MRRSILLIFFVFLGIGCNHWGPKIQMYMDDPKTILEDPLSVNYQGGLDDLESRYLRKEITYAEYLEQRRQLEEDYAKEAQQRRDTIEGSR